MGEKHHSQRLRMFFMIMVLAAHLSDNCTIRIFVCKLAEMYEQHFKRACFSLGCSIFCWLLEVSCVVALRTVAMTKHCTTCALLPAGPLSFLFFSWRNTSPFDDFKVIHVSSWIDVPIYRYIEFTIFLLMGVKHDKLLWFILFAS